MTLSVMGGWSWWQGSASWSCVSHVPWAHVFAFTSPKVARLLWTGPVPVAGGEAAGPIRGSGSAGVKDRVGTLCHHVPGVWGCSGVRARVAVLLQAVAAGTSDGCSGQERTEAVPWEGTGTMGQEGRGAVRQEGTGTMGQEGTEAVSRRDPAVPGAAGGTDGAGAPPGACRRSGSRRRARRSIPGRSVPPPSSWGKEKKTPKLGNV